jgi:ubiquinone/menaquinone biosynthesis C-methylase UbiE
MKFNFSIDGKEYEKMLGSFHKYYIKVKCKELLKFLKEIDYHPQVVLDLGCGTGEVEEILYRFFNKIVGIDLSEDMLREANTKRIPNCKFEKANILKLPFKNNSFDLVFSFCAFHHLLKNERYSALKEATRVILLLNMLSKNLL